MKVSWWVDKKDWMDLKKVALTAERKVEKKAVLKVEK